MANIVQFNKEQVLTSASGVFQKKGYNGTSMQDLVEATGLNRSSIYNSFGSKMDLYLASLDTYDEMHSSAQNEVCSEANNGLDAIKNIFALFIKTILEDLDNRGCMVINCKTESGSSGHKKLIDWLIRSDKKGLRFFETQIARGQEDGSINKDQSVKQYSIYLSASLQGLRMIGIMNKNRKDLEALASTFIHKLT